MRIQSMIAGFVLMVALIGIHDVTRARAQSPGSISASGVATFTNAHQVTVTFDPSFTVDVCTATWRQIMGLNTVATVTHSANTAIFYAFTGNGAPVYATSSLDYICLGH